MALRSFLKRNCRSFYCILYGKRKDTWKKTRYFWSALAGTFCAWLMIKFIFASFTISKRYENQILLFTILIVGLYKCYLFNSIFNSLLLRYIASGYIFTDAMKCITIMMFISLMGKSGRSYMRALSFAFVISGIRKYSLNSIFSNFFYF